MAINMYGNYTPDANPFAPANTGSFIGQPMTGYTPPTAAEQIGQGIQRSFDSANQQGLSFINPTATSSGGNFLGNLMNLGGQYYMGQEGIRSAEGIGRQGMQQAQALAQQARADTEFRPFTVTTGTGVSQTTPTGGLDVGLGATAGALEQQLQEQAGGLFGRVGVDPATAQQEYFEQIRGVQRPEEERQRLAMEERLLGQGRLGLMTSQYGGAPEQFALAKAQEEARNQAAVMARSQALAEQQQALQMGSGLLGQSFVPQQQQLDALTAATNIANIAGTGQRTGAQLAAQLGSQGLENLIRSYENVGLLEQQEQDTLARLLLGGAGGQSGMLSSLGVGESSTPDWIKGIGDYFGFGGESGSRDVAAAGGLFGRIFGGGS